MRWCKQLTWVESRKQVSWKDTRKNAKALWNNVYTGTHVRIVSHAITETQSHGERPASNQRVGNAPHLAEYGSTTWMRRKSQYSSPPSSTLCICFPRTLTPASTLRSEIKRELYIYNEMCCCIFFMTIYNIWYKRNTSHILICHLWKAGGPGQVAKVAPFSKCFPFFSFSFFFFFFFLNIISYDHDIDLCKQCICWWNLFKRLTNI